MKVQRGFHAPAPLARRRTRVLALATGLWGFALALPCLAAEEGAEAGGLAASIQQFAKTSFWGVVAFLIVLAILWKFLFPPIVEALDRRARTIEDALKAAERAKADAEQLIAQHEAGLEKARTEARAIIDEAKEDALSVKNGIVADARRESEEIAARTKREIHLARQAAVEDLYRQAAHLSLDLAEKVIQKSLQPEDHKELIDNCIQSYRETV